MRPEVNRSVPMLSGYDDGRAVRGHVLISVETFFTMLMLGSRSTMSKYDRTKGGKTD